MGLQILIIGGGLAGLTAAIHLKRLNHEVRVIEKQTYPRHKVCGEYISNEVRNYLENLGLNLSELGAVSIKKGRFTAANEIPIDLSLGLGGFGISRHTLEKALLDLALSLGVELEWDSVENVQFEKDNFQTELSSGKVLASKIVLGAYGKRAVLDKRLGRHFINQRAPWLAVKCHYEGPFPKDRVSLHFFEGGYCGISSIENEKINCCYLVSLKKFRQYKDIEAFENALWLKQPFIQQELNNAKPIFDKPLTISQIAFTLKELVHNHILMIGDTAGVIHPLCGNGMAMAIHAAKLACEEIHSYSIHQDRHRLETQYVKQWKKNFSHRLRMGRWLSACLHTVIGFKLMYRLLQTFPVVWPVLIKQTQGKPIA